MAIRKPKSDGPRDWTVREIKETTRLLQTLPHKDIVALIKKAGVEFPTTSAEEVDDEQLIGILFSDWDRDSLLDALRVRQKKASL
jgi:hypothetical protein